jgi:Zn-dependent peptidase ImmA (M78 family)
MAIARRTPDEGVARREATALLTAEDVTAWPVSPEALAARAGLRIVETAQGFPRGAYGALVKIGPAEFQIMLSSHCPNSGHRRFTLAHELGHYHIPDHVDVLLANDPAHFSRAGHFRGRKEWWEVEADAFAAELLVPSVFVNQVLSGVTHGLAAVRLLAEEFDISLSCAAVRYAAATPDPVLVVLSRDGIVEWTCCASCVRDHRWHRNLGRGDWSPPRSATATVMRSAELVRESAVRTRTDVLPSWVEGAPAVAILEEALGLGAWGRVLTVLACEELPSPEEQEAQEQRREAGPRTWTAGLREWRWDEFDEQH